MPSIASERVSRIGVSGIMFAAVIQGMLFVGLADAVVSMSLPGVSPGSAGGSFGFVLLVMAKAAAIGLVAGLAGAALGMMGRVPGVGWRGRRIGWGLLLILGALAVFLEWANLALFDGPDVSRRSWAPAAKWILRLLLPVVVAIGGAWTLRWLTRAIEGRRRAAAATLGVFSLLVSAGLVTANACVHPGLYDFIHTQEVVLAALLAALGVVLMQLPQARRPAGLLTGPAGMSIIALALVVGGALIRRHDDYQAIAGSVAARAAGTSEYGAFADRLLDLLVARPPVTAADAATLAAELSAPGTPEARDRFRAIAGIDSFNVLWIALDTVRADHCGFMGYPRKTTPTLDRLAAEAFVFERAYAPYPTSNYSYSSLLTSLPPRITPAYKHYKNTDFSFPADTPLPALLGRHGFKTVGITAFDRDTANRPDWFGSLREGFGTYNPDQQQGASFAPEIVASVTKAVDGLVNDRWFLWVHFLDPHAPYVHHDGFEFGPERTDLYDSEIAYVDAHAGRILDQLERTGQTSRTIVVVFSDHGEEFQEHGASYHNSNVYDPQVRVPLLVRIPGMAGRRVPEAVNLLDLLPTMVDLLGIDDPVRRFGRSLLPLMSGMPGQRGFSYSECFGWKAGRHARDQRALVLDDHKLILRPQQDTYELFDLRRDPMERRTLVGREPEVEQRLLGLIREWDRRIDAYHAGSGTPAPGADPKDAYLTRIEELVSGLADADPRIGAERLDGLRALVFNAFYEPLPDAERFLGRDGIARLIDRLVAMAPRLPPPVIQRLALALGYSRDGRHKEFLAGLLEHPSAPLRMVAALSLGLVGDGTGRDLLRTTIGQPVAPNKQMMAVALARLGDAACLEWMFYNLWDIHRQVLVPSLRVMGHLDPALSGARVVRDIFASPRYRSPEVNLSLIEGVKARLDRDPDALLLVLRLVQDKEEEVRVAAAAALENALPPEDLRRNAEAMVLEIDGDLAVINGVLELAVTHYERSLAAGTLYNSALRLRLARALHLSGQAESARGVLEDVAKNSDVGADRPLAQRRLGQLTWPAAPDARTFQCEIDAARVVVPERFLPGDAFALGVPFKNAGPAALQGGMWRCGLCFTVAFVDPQGAVIAARSRYENWLPEAGLDPGEERVLSIVGIAPPSVRDARLTVVLTCAGMTLPQGGRIYEHAEPVTF